MPNPNLNPRPSSSPNPSFHPPSPEPFCLRIKNRAKIARSVQIPAENQGDTKGIAVAMRLGGVHRVLHKVLRL